MKNLSKNLRNLLNKAKLSENELGRRTGIPQQVINRILNGQNDNPKLATLTALASYFMVSVSQLISDNLNIKNSKLSASHSGWIEAPLLKWQEIRNFCDGLKKKTSRKAIVLTDVQGSDKIFASKMPDDSMELKFEQGCLLIFDPERKPQDGDFVLYNSQNDPTLYFRQILIKNKNIYVRCLNPKLNCYKPTLIQDGLQCIAVLIQSRSNYFVATHHRPATRASIKKNGR